MPTGVTHPLIVETVSHLCISNPTSQRPGMVRFIAMIQNTRLESQWLIDKR
jgi:hypothetical protein